MRKWERQKKEIEAHKKNLEAEVGNIEGGETGAAPDVDMSIPAVEPEPAVELTPAELVRTTSSVDS